MSSHLTAKEKRGQMYYSLRVYFSLCGFSITCWVKTSWRKPSDHKRQLFQDTQLLQKPLHLNLNLSLIQLKSPAYDVIEL